MKKRNYLLLRAWLTTGMTILFIALLLSGKVENSMIYLAILFIIISAFVSYRYFKQAQKVGSEEVIHSAPPNATDAQLIKFYKRVLIVGIIAFTALTLIDIYELNILESGTGESAEIYGPVLFLYKNGGYWLAALSVPVFGILCILMLYRKISILKSKF